VLIVGLADRRAYQLPGFTTLRDLSRDLGRVPGVTRVLALPTLPLLTKDSARAQFMARPLFAPFPATQARLDRLLTRTEPLYQGQVLNPRTGVTLLALTLDPAYVNSARLQAVLHQITSRAALLVQAKLFISA